MHSRASHTEKHQISSSLTGADPLLLFIFLKKRAEMMEKQHI